MPHLNEIRTDKRRSSEDGRLIPELLASRYATTVMPNKSNDPTPETNAVQCFFFGL